MLSNAIRLMSKLAKLNREALSQHIDLRRMSKTLNSGDCDWSTLDQTVMQETEPVFVLSTGRCGTELLTLMFNATSDVACFHSPKPELLLASKHAYEVGVEGFEKNAASILSAITR